jgi:ATP adenylyltransferase
MNETTPPTPSCKNGGGLVPVDKEPAQISMANHLPTCYGRTYGIEAARIITMSQDHMHSNVETRFAASLGLTSESCNLFDKVLFETDEFVVIPTLGSIVPNWLLVVPRKESLSFANWSKKSLKNPSDVLDQVLAHFMVASDQVVWFEHGPNVVGTSVGCGVDRAHLHVIINPPFAVKALSELAKENFSGDWQEFASMAACYNSVAPSSSYLTLGSDEFSVMAQDVEGVGSQFFRKIIAKLCGTPEQWDYRRHAHLGNIEKTLAALL